MTHDERIIEGLAVTLDNMLLISVGSDPEKRRRAAEAVARSVWSRIDRDALRAALLADVRRGVEELPTHEFIDSYEPGTLWLAVDRAAVLRLLGDQEVRR